MMSPWMKSFSIFSSKESSSVDHTSKSFHFFFFLKKRFGHPKELAAVVFRNYGL